MVSATNWGLTARKFGTHVKVEMRCGTPSSRALLGVLTMTLAEWADFKRRFRGAAITEEGF